MAEYFQNQRPECLSESQFDFCPAEEGCADTLQHSQIPLRYSAAELQRLGAVVWSFPAPFSTVVDELNQFSIAQSQ
jgi:hypothetical protein